MIKNLLPILSFLLLFTVSVQGQTSYEDQRKQMIKTQIEARGISHSATLASMMTVPRHEFVPENQRAFSYSDSPLPIGNGQTISQPYIVAFMTQALKPRSSDKVLEIGTGSGYQAAVLSEIVDTVYTIEIVKELAFESQKRLKQLGYKNIRVKHGDGYNGWPKVAPFDAIIVTAGAESIPQPLVDQLKIGGRMIIPVGAHNAVRQLVLIIKKKDRLIKKNVMPVRFVPFTRDKNQNRG